MKKKIITLLVALMATVASAYAQQISVVAPNGATTLYRTLPDAIKGATAGSVVYLPGGGFSIPDSVKITKKLTVIGIGHKAKSDNVDGATIIAGNLWFNEGSSGSAVLGCYIIGNVNIGEDGIVNNVTVKLCNLDVVNVKNNNCTGTLINNCYIRGYACDFSNAAVTVKNNIMTAIHSMTGGIVKNNILTAEGGKLGGGRTSGKITFRNVHNTTICNNIILATGEIEARGTNDYSGDRNSGLITYKNMNKRAWGEDAIDISAEWDEVFEKYNNGAISPASNFHFKDEYKEYENQVGIYAGDGFSDGALPPVPYIVAKKIDDKTDAAGKLNIKVRVKASE